MSLAIVAAAGLLSLAQSSQAQTNTPGMAPPPGGRRGGMTAEARLMAFDKSLGETNKLSDVQKPKVKAVFEAQTKAMQELMAQRDTLSQEDLRAKRTALMEDTNKKMKEILNPEQFKIWEQTAQRRPGARRQGGAGGAGGATGGGGQPN